MNATTMHYPTKRILLLGFIITVAAISAPAQVGEGYHGHGYVFAAPGGIKQGGNESVVHFGGGGERLIYRGLGAGAELGYVAPTILGILSANGSYHFVNRATPRKLVPFVTAGYSYAFSSGGTAHLANFGGGVNYWFHPRAAARLEFRDHMETTSYPLHIWGFRFGLSFR